VLDLFPEGEKMTKRISVGRTEVLYKNASSILTPGKGFMGNYDFTLNPYSGCSFGCTYCYAAFFSRLESQREQWGYWLQVKENSLALLMKFRKKPLHNKTIYMSSVTDPYQPIEKELSLTRSLLKELLEYHQPRLVVQTRSSLVTRDIDLLKKFKTVQVNMTVTTDSEAVRKTFEPLCPSNSVRLKAIKQIHKAGINSCITMTPLLPVDNAERFASDLVNTGIKKFIIQPFHAEKGKFVASTRGQAMSLIKKMNWTSKEYERVLLVIKQHIPEIGIGKEGFKPV
jgi:DNA repair photolyase